jgi:hypothetical protein
MPGKMARSDPRPSVRVTRGASSGQHLASVLQEGRENANIDAGLGFIWRISANSGRAHPHSLGGVLSWQPATKVHPAAPPCSRLAIAARLLATRAAPRGSCWRTASRSIEWSNYDLRKQS